VHPAAHARTAFVAATVITEPGADVIRDGVLLIEDGGISANADHRAREALPRGAGRTDRPLRRGAAIFEATAGACGAARRRAFPRAPR